MRNLHECIVEAAQEVDRQKMQRTFTEAAVRETVEMDLHDEDNVKDLLMYGTELLAVNRRIDRLAGELGRLQRLEKDGTFEELEAFGE